MFSPTVCWCAIPPATEGSIRGQVLHGSARTTAAVRRAIQQSQESLNTLAERYGVNPKTVAKWKKRAFAHDAPMGPKKPASTVLTKEEEAICVAFRQHTLLPLDDGLYALQPTIPHLSRSALHRCSQRHGISRLPDIEGDKPAKKKFKAYPIGDFHLDMAEVRTEEGKLYLFVAIDRTSQFAYVEGHATSDRNISTAFLRNLLHWQAFYGETARSPRLANLPPRFTSGHFCNNSSFHINQTIPSPSFTSVPAPRW